MESAQALTQLFSGIKKINMRRNGETESERNYPEMLLTDQWCKVVKNLILLNLNEGNRKDRVDTEKMGR